MNLAFRRALKPHHVFAVALGGTISSSYFLANGYMLSQVGPMAFLTFFLGGFATYLTLECMAELTQSEDVPRHPTFIGYADKYISPFWACGIGWAYYSTWMIYICVECLAGGILLHVFIPEISTYMWSMLCCASVIAVNLAHVRIFGAAAFGLTFTHIILFFGFSFIAILIFFGFIGSTHEFIGMRYFLQDGLFPKGVAAIFINLMIMLFSFQGSEIVGFSASETHLPKKNLPRTMRRIAMSVTMLYLSPILLLALIFPWQKATLAESAFAVALQDYNLIGIAKIFSLLIVAGSLSCANSGVYVAVRTAHALTELDMNPKWFQKLSPSGIPGRLTWISFAILLSLLQLSRFYPPEKVYLTYLSATGTIGAIVWCTICWCQIRFRKQLNKTDVKSLTFKTPFFPYFAYCSIAIQCACIFFCLFSQELRHSFLISIPSIGIPMLWYALSKRSKTT